MNKLFAVFSSIAVSVSALAVSVLSYFPSPVNVGATAPDTSGLVYTTLSDSGTYPTIVFPRSSLVQDLSSTILFCPTGWVSSSSYVTGVRNYGNYVQSNGYFSITLSWSASTSSFSLNAVSFFSSGLPSKMLFSFLSLGSTTVWAGLPSQWVIFQSVCPNESAYSVKAFSFDGFYADPSALSGDPTYTFRGTIGNDCSLWLQSRGYDAGKVDGYDEGYDEGYGEGYADGQFDGYSNGYSVGHSAGYSLGYGDGNGDGWADGYQDGYGEGVTAGSQNFGMWDLFSNAFGSVANVLSIQLFPGLTIGLLISVPIAFAFLLWLIHVLKG